MSLLSRFGGPVARRRLVPVEPPVEPPVGTPGRLYLTSVAPDFTPATVRGTWSDASRTGNVYSLGRAPAGTNVALSAAETSTVNPTRVLLSRHVSGPLTGGAVTVDMSLRLTQARSSTDVAASMRAQIAAWVTVGNTDTVRGWLLNPFGGATVWPTTATAFSFILGADVAFTVQPGDRLVVELGYTAVNAVATSYTGTTYIGGTAGDLAQTGTADVTIDSPWIDITGPNADVVFAPYVAPAPGAFTEMLNQPFTATNGLASTYHVFGAGHTTSTAKGLLIELHGDGAFSYLNPNSTYYLGGTNGLKAVGKAKGYLVVSALAPDTVGSVTWWENGPAKAVYVRDLLAKILADYPSIAANKVWFSVFSGGSQLLTEYFLPTHSSTVAGGGAVIFGGGEAPSVAVVPFTAGFKAAFPMHWVVGELDDGSTEPDGFNGRGAAEAGRSYYQGQGFTTTLELVANTAHDLPGLFGGYVNSHLPSAL